MDTLEYTVLSLNQSLRTHVPAREIYGGGLGIVRVSLRLAPAVKLDGSLSIACLTPLSYHIILSHFLLSFFFSTGQPSHSLSISI